MSDASSALSESLRELPKEAMSPGRLAGIFAEHQGYLSDKWIQYLSVYERELRPLIALGRALCLLEIGVQNGGSLEIWQKYLPKDSRVFGLDIDWRCRRLVFPPQVSLIIADAANRGELDRQFGGLFFDIIIDDGSHRCSDVISSFKNLFHRLLPGGKYIIEDMHASYWHMSGGGVRNNESSIEWLKKLVDALHVDYFDIAEIEQEEGKFLLDMNSQISQISFYDSVAVIEKYPEQKLVPFTRILSGRSMDVVGPADFATVVLASPERFGFSQSAWQGIRDSLVVAAQKLAADRAGALSEAEEQLTRTRAAMSAEIETLREELVHLQLEREERQATLANLEVELTAANDRNSRAEAQAAQAAAEIETLREELVHLQREKCELAEAVAKAEYEREERQATLASLEADLTDLREKLAETELEVQRQGAEIRHQTTKAEAAHAQVPSLTRALAEAESRVQEQHSAVERMQAQATQLRQELITSRQVNNRLVAAVRAADPASPPSDALLRNPGVLFRLVGSRLPI
jgi:SAM-dependent methyltransferase/predicted  nucleic acid-binding Zn-ribbon protein